MALTTGKVRLSYCHVWQPMTSQNGGEPKYSVTLLIPKTDISTINAIYAEMERVKQEGVTSTWKGTLPPVVKIPLYDGDGVRASGEPFGPECRGCMVITASSKSQPQVVDLNVQPILNQTEIYSGCYGRVNIGFFAYDQSGNRGLGCALNCIQKVEDGEPLAGGISAQEAFGGSNAYAGAGGMPPVPGAIGSAGGVLPVPQGSNTYGYGTAVPGTPTPPMPQINVQPTAMQINAQPYQQSANAQQAAMPGMYQQPGVMDPITGRPAISGGVMGL